jgi:hypothetical protein
MFELEECEWSRDEECSVAPAMYAACREMWVAVLHRAIKDVAGVIPADWRSVSEALDCPADGTGALRGLEKDVAIDFFKLVVADEAVDWFESDAIEVGSFLWCCSWLDLNAVSVRTMIGAMRESDLARAGVLRLLGRRGGRRRVD